MESEATITSEAKTIVADTESLALRYNNYVVTDNEQYILSSEELKVIKKRTDEIESLRKSITKPLDDSKKRIMDFFRPALELLTRAEISVKNAILFYQQQQEKKRLAEETRMQELAKKGEEKRREALLKRAETAEAKGKGEKAEELREQAEIVNIPAPIIPSTVPKINGLSKKTVWKYKIMNELLIPREYLIPNEKMLQGVATATKGTLPVAGVEFYSEEIISSTRGELIK